MPDTSSRPRPATFAAWVIMVGSVFVVVSAYESIARLHSLETQEAIREFLDRPPGDGLGISFDQARTALHYASLVAGASAAATAILGFQVLKGNGGARLPLTLLSVPLLPAGLATGGFFPALVVAAVATLWMQPTSSWLLGRPLPTPSAPGGGGEGGTPPAWQTPQSLGPTVVTSPAMARASAGERPRTIVTACVITWVMCGLVAAVMALTVAVVVAVPDQLMETAREAQPELMADTGLTDDQLVGSMLVAGALAMLWCLTSSLLAVGAYRGRAWGRIGLLVSSASVGALCVFLMVGSLVMFVPLVTASVTFGLLLRPESRAWCRPDASPRS